MILCRNKYSVQDRNAHFRILRFEVKNIDFKNHYVMVDHLLLLKKRGSQGYYIEAPKTVNCERVIPMTPDVEECFKDIIANRKPHKIESIVEGYTGFLYFDKYGSIFYVLHWEHYIEHIVEKHNCR